MPPPVPTTSPVSPHLLDPDAMWVFGRGSMVWRPDLAAVEERLAVLPGAARRFWPGSPDHGGPPAAPGRALTFVDDPDGHCVGRAFRIRADAVAPTLRALEHREKAGYAQDLREVQTDLGAAYALVHLALPGNPNGLGAAPVEAIADHGLRCHGPNREYVLELDRALIELGAPRGHVAEVARAAPSKEASWTPR